MSIVFKNLSETIVAGANGNRTYFLSSKSKFSATATRYSLKSSM